MNLQKEHTDGRKLFATALDQSLELFPPQVQDGNIIAKPSCDVNEEGIRVWQHSLVAQFLGQPSKSEL